MDIKEKNGWAIGRLIELRAIFMSIILLLSLVFYNLYYLISIYLLI